MKDVIFTGAKSSMNIAEVTLTFSNEDKKLDLDYDKVDITRRIYRSGENEYKINNKRVRLKDIRELFFDTGVGKEGYSIIGQGRIDEIIMSSPKDRRAIFEEAAGISKHKFRRDEANKKLEFVNDDLEIIEKELEYKKKDFNLIKSYKDNFLKHKNLTEEINQKSYFYLKNKSYDLIKRRDRIDFEIREMDENLLNLKAQNKEISEKLSPFKKNYEKEKAKLDRLINEYNSYEKNIEKNESSLKLNDQKLDYDIKDKERIEEVLASLATNLEKESKNLKENEAKNEGLLESINAFEKDLLEKKEKRKELEEEIKVISAELEKEKDLESEIKSKILDYQVFEQSRAIIDEKRKKDLEEKRFRLEKLDQEISSIKSTFSNLSGKRSAIASEVEKLKSEISTMADEINFTRQKLEKDQNTLTNIKLDMKSLLSDYKIEKNLLENNQGYFYPVQDFLKKSKINGLGVFYLDTLANLISVREGYEDIIDNLMGAGLQNIVTKTKEDTRELINFVNREKLGRLTFLPIDSIKSFMKERPHEPEVIAMAYELVGYEESLSGIVGHFLGSTVVVKDIDDAISLSKKIKGYRIISLNLDIINTWGSMVAGTNKNKRTNTNILNRKKKLLDLEKSIQKLNIKKTDFEKSIYESEKILTERKEKLTGFKNDFEEKANSLAKISSELERTSLKLDSLKQNRKDLDGSSLDYEERQIDLDIDKLKEEEKALSIRIDEKTKLIKEKENLKASLRDDIIGLTNKIEISQRDKSLIQNTLANTRTNIEDIRSNQNIQTKLLRKIKEEIENSNKKKGNLIKSVELFSKEKDGLEREISKLRANIKSKEEENIKLINANEDLEEKIRDLEMKRVKLSYKLDSANENYKNLEDEVSPYISMSLDDLREKYKDSENINPTKSDLIEIQKKINEVGFFTDTALEDFDTIDKELKFINEQVNDLRGSKADIEKMIVRLEKEMKDEFSKNFAIINQNFTKIFKILFMGGDARLILDSEDFLTAGVEIEAKPPSKSLKSISLLSGGEKALTAVALLFAIFEQNPAPFSILDEIDAALDESNIKRYIDYLKGLSDKTQFIMITHRQTTMQLAEKIHGVTIDDEGMSKLYSIGFESNWIKG